eukprot:comp15031_c0_seq1/m.22332 comp15031_c0_seq1/g.22332  ORF comp15031_c0_seq1/g.22332 comp15031_c0_seq1/m.22332 type:complete len:113 (-) comp15031_c0_seq1:57-395(-)
MSRTRTSGGSAGSTGNGTFFPFGQAQSQTTSSFISASSFRFPNSTSVVSELEVNDSEFLDRLTESSAAGLRASATDEQRALALDTIQHLRAVAAQLEDDEWLYEKNPALRRI